MARWRDVFRLALLVCLMGSLTLGLQSWIGDRTIYAKGLEQQREELHFAILANRAPDGKSWSAVGGQSIQKRVGVVYIAQALHGLVGLSIGKTYKLLDTVFLFTSLLLLFFLLRRWVPDVYSLVGVLYFAAVLPLTYFFQLFHPWDRLQLATWIGLLFLVVDRKLVYLSIGLVLSMVVKFDVIMLPFLYFMAHVTRERWRRVAIETMGLSVLGFGTYFALGELFPAPLDQSHFTPVAALGMLAANWTALRTFNIAYPPLLVHALPSLLALCCLSSKDRFVWSSVIFAFCLSVVFILFTHYEEVRAHMIVLVLVLPSALLTLQRLLGDGRTLPSREPAKPGN